MRSHAVLISIFLHLIACSERDQGTGGAAGAPVAGAGGANLAGATGVDFAGSGVSGGATPLADGSGAGSQVGAGGGGGMPGSAGAQNLGGAAVEPLPASDECTLYASPNGAGSECTAQVPCSLEGARDKARTLNRNMTEDLVVCLGGGTYWLTQPFSLTQNATLSDSGSNGFNVVYQALEGASPVLSGGRRIQGFALHDAANDVFRAPAPNLRSRQLFVNGVRATRARSSGNYGMSFHAQGFTANTAELASFKQPKRIELAGELDWRHYRCPVEAIEGTNVRLQEPCWSLSQDVDSGWWWNFKEVTWVENALELLDEEGEFYLDEEAGAVYYKPRAGEDLTTAEVVAPVLEALVIGQGSPDAPLRNLVFRGITFAHGTWHGSSTSYGYTSYQSGFLHRTIDQYWDTAFYVMPSNVVFRGVESVRLEGNTFRNLGGSGLHIYDASRNNSVIGNRFQDISGRAITLGNIDDPEVSEERMVRGHVIKNNAIFESGIEYRDCAIIVVVYTQDTLIEHNWLRGGPYIGVSLGWGWTNYPNQASARNIVRWNRIEDFMRHTFDGSGVYMLGPQRESSIDHNYIYRGLPRGEGIFPDQGASYASWEWNVIEDVGYQWIHDWSDSAHHNVIRYNITNQPNYEYRGNKAHDIWGPNTIVTDGNWPPEYHEIKAKAGLEPEFAHIAE